MIPTSPLKQTRYMNINDYLFDECLLAIFDHLPIVDLLVTLPTVCVRWYCLVYSAACRRRSITLLSGRDPLCLLRRPFNTPYLDGVCDSTGRPVNEPYNELQVVTLRTLTPAGVARLALAFPNVTSLEMVLDLISPECSKYANLMLIAMSNRLVTLKLYVRYEEPKPAAVGQVTTVLESAMAAKAKETISVKIRSLLRTINGLSK